MLHYQNRAFCMVDAVIAHTSQKRPANWSISMIIVPQYMLKRWMFMIDRSDSDHLFIWPNPRLPTTRRLMFISSTALQILSFGSPSRIRVFAFNCKEENSIHHYIVFNQKLKQGTWIGLPNSPCRFRTHGRGFSRRFARDSFWQIPLDIGWIYKGIVQS